METLLLDFSDPVDTATQLEVLDADGYGQEARRAFGVLIGLLRSLGLDDLGRLGLPNSRNHARLVRRTGGEQAVLKLTVVAFGNETGALRAWEHAGLAGTITASLYAWGGTEEGWQWSLQERLPGTTRHPAHGFPVLEPALETAAKLHLPATNLPDVFEIREPSLAESATSQHPGLARTARRVRREIGRHDFGATVVLHGDFGPNNLLDDGSGTLRVIDPAGMCGPAAYDAARYLARSTSSTPVAPRLEGTATRFGHDPETLGLLAAMELVELASLAPHWDISGRGRDGLLADAAAILDYCC